MLHEEFQFIDRVDHFLRSGASAVAQVLPAARKLREGEREGKGMGREGGRERGRKEKRGKGRGRRRGGEGREGKEG